jgi:hypothetical protein
MEQWTTTEDVKLAAAFGTMGMPLRINRCHDDSTGTETCRFGVGLCNVEGTESTAKLRAALNNGTLIQNKPNHALLVILRTFENRERILDFAKQQKGMTLMRQPGADTWQYFDGPAGLDGVKRGDAIVKTGDLKLAAALATIGLPLVKLEGSPGQYTFTVRCLTPAGEAKDPVPMIEAWRKDKASLPWEEPFAQAMRGLYNRERLLDAVRVAERKILIRPNVKAIKSALISEHSSPAAWDRVHHFLTGA